MVKRDLQKKRFGNSNRTALDSVMDELKVLKQLEHPNTLWLHEIIDDKDYIMLVTTYYPKGSLGDKVRVLNDTEHNQHNDECRLNGDLSGLRTKGIKPWEARYYFIDMLKALYYIHEVVKVVHKDIKPDNIMIGEDN